MDLLITCVEDGDAVHGRVPVGLLNVCLGAIDGFESLDSIDGDVVWSAPDDGPIFLMEGV